MSFRRYASCLAIVIVSLPVSAPAAVSDARADRWQTVTFDGVRLRVPASWPVIRFAADPSACPRLDVHAVYLGAPGPDPRCPAGLVGRSEAVLVEPSRQASAGHRAAGPIRAAVRSGGKRSAIVGRPDVTRTITEDLPRRGVRVSISYRTSRKLAETIRSSIAVVAGRDVQRAGRQAGGLARAAGAAAGSGVAGDRASGHRAGAGPTAGSGGVGQGLFAGSGFDSCAAPSAGTMTKWLASSYRAVGIYIGGVNRACAQANLTPSWLTAIAGQGWHYFPIYPGLQSSCVLASGDATITTSKAAAQGLAAADDAVARAASLGIGKGTPLIFDMEAYAPACDSQVTTFLSAWDAELNARGYRSAVYESFSNIGALAAAARSVTEPDVIYYADWDGQATTTSPYMPAGMWTDHARIHQYLGGHLETHGGATIDIDSDQLDVRLGGGSVVRAGHSGYRVAVAINSNGTAEWFARSAGHALSHAWQQPVGSLTWSAVHTVGKSPTTIVSNPSAVAQADGKLTVFARDRAGRVEHGWQQAGFPNDWEWGTPLAASPRPPLRTTDPAAVRLPRGEVEVFESLADGSVGVTRQRRPNHNTRWTPWTSIGGSCASSPVPVVDPGHGTEVLCVTAAGTAASDHWNGRAWSGWSTLTGSPANLAGVPAAAVDGSGQIEFFAASKSGGLDHAWISGSPARHAWTWGSPLAGPGSAAGGGTRIAGSPAAATWPSGFVIVYAKLAGGQVGYIRNSRNSGSSAWSGWASVASIPGGTIGSPVGWLNSGGPAGVAALDGNRMLAVSSNSGSGWQAWTEIGGGF